MSLSEKIQEIKSTFDSDYKSVKNNQLDNQLVYNKYLGRKGLINTLYPLLAKVHVDEKSEFGKKINDLKNHIASKLDDKQSTTKSSKNKL